LRLSFLTERSYINSMTPEYCC